MKSIKQNIEILITFFAGLIMRLYYANLDPYLHEWDERYHALVSRNMIDNFLTPMLTKNPIVPYELNEWAGNSIWLHKQPLFMWQIAISMKLLGINEFVLRLPSVIMGSITILFIYRITILFTNNKTTSIIASLLICFSQYQLELISGQIGMDHNDMAFCFYILASFWALSEKIKKEKLIWNILIGMFAGCAILNKWLVGLLVFLPLGIYEIKQFIIEKKYFKMYNILLSFLCCILVFLPWQLYILNKFHDLAIYEYNYNTQHIFKAVEGHSGSFSFYFENFSDYFGRYFMDSNSCWYDYRNSKRESFNKIINWSLSISFITVFIFFSFIVKSKLPTYFFIVAPFGIIYIAIGIQQILQIINIKWLNFCLINLAVIISLNPYKSVAKRKDNEARENLIYNTKIYKKLNKILPKNIKTVINVSAFENIDVMFYNNDITAYHWWIDVKHLDSLKNKKIWIGAFKNHGDYNLPIEYNNYPYLYIIDVTLK